MQRPQDDASEHLLPPGAENTVGPFHNPILEKIGYFPQDSTLSSHLHLHPRSSGPGQSSISVPTSFNDLESTVDNAYYRRAHHGGNEFGMPREKGHRVKISHIIYFLIACALIGFGVKELLLKKETGKSMAPEFAQKVAAAVSTTNSTTPAAKPVEDAPRVEESTFIRTSTTLATPETAPIATSVEDESWATRHWRELAAGAGVVGTGLGICCCCRGRGRAAAGSPEIPPVTPLQAAGQIDGDFGSPSDSDDDGNSDIDEQGDDENNNNNNIDPSKPRGNRSGALAPTPSAEKSLPAWVTKKLEELRLKMETDPRVQQVVNNFKKAQPHEQLAIAKFLVDTQHGFDDDDRIGEPAPAVGGESGKHKDFDWERRMVPLEVVGRSKFVNWEWNFDKEQVSDSQNPLMDAVFPAPAREAFTKALDDVKGGFAKALVGGLKFVWPALKLVWRVLPDKVKNAVIGLCTVTVAGSAYLKDPSKMLSPAALPVMILRKSGSMIRRRAPLVGKAIERTASAMNTSRKFAWYYTFWSAVRQVLGFLEKGWTPVSEEASKAAQAAKTLFKALQKVDDIFVREFKRAVGLQLPFEPRYVPTAWSLLKTIFVKNADHSSNSSVPLTYEVKVAGAAPRYPIAEKAVVAVDPLNKRLPSVQRFVGAPLAIRDFVPKEERSKIKAGDEVTCEHQFATEAFRDIMVNQLLRKTGDVAVQDELGKLKRWGASITHKSRAGWVLNPAGGRTDAAKGLEEEEKGTSRLAWVGDKLTSGWNGLRGMMGQAAAAG